MNPIQLTICSRDAKPLVDALSQVDFINIIQASSETDTIDPDSVSVLLADPDLAAELVEKCENLVWMQSTWAGNNALGHIAEPSFTLTVARGIFAKQMREYVFAYLLGHSRKTLEVENHNREKGTWQSFDIDYLAGKTLGIAGAGSIAKSLLPLAAAFEMNVIGLNTSGDIQAGYQKMFSPEAKLDFAQSCDGIVNLMPETTKTRHFFDNAFFSRMRKNSIFINAGRGTAIDNGALLQALEVDAPSLAVLDVFEKEPLPSSSPLWHHPKVRITHHTAAITQIQDIAKCFLDNAQRYAAGQPLVGLFNWKTGY